MKKFLFTVLTVITVLVGVSVAFLWVSRTSLISSSLSTALQMPVSIGQIDVTGKRVVVKDIVISNPPGNQLPTAFSADEISIDLAFPDLLQNPTLIKQVAISNSLIGIEMYNLKGEKNNWQQVLESIPNDPPNMKTTHAYVVESLVVNNLQIHARNRFVSSDLIAPPMIKHLEFKNLSSDNPLAKDQIVELIASMILSEVRKFPALANILKEVHMLPVRALRAIIKPLGEATEALKSDPVAEFGALLDRVLGKDEKESKD